MDEDSQRVPDLLQDCETGSQELKDSSKGITQDTLNALTCPSTPVEQSGSPSPLLEPDHLDDGLQHDGVRKDILTFRTITTLLAQIRHKSVFKYSITADKGKGVINSVNLMNLRTLGALSTIAAAGRGSVALRAKRRPDRFELLACFAASAAHKDGTSPSMAPDTSTATSLEHLDDECIEKCVAKRFCNLKPHQSPSTHLSIIAKLLVTKVPKPKDYSIEDRLLPYVIVSCHEKMLRRLENASVSIPYIKALKSITSIPYSDAQKSPVKNDKGWDRFFLTYSVVELVKQKKLQCEVPNLLEQARLAEQKEPYRAYNSKTCMELHMLWLELLDLFRRALLDLRASYAQGSAAKPAERRAYVRDIILVGGALHALVKGSLLDHHLHTISLSLNQYHSLNKQLASASTSHSTAKDSDNDEEEEEYDADLEAVLPSAVKEFPRENMPLWKYYSNWMKLIVTHFEAVHVLDWYATDRPILPSMTISIRVLSPAPPNSDSSRASRVQDKALLPWRELNRDADFKVFRDHFLNDDNDKIVHFLEKAANSNVDESLCWVQEARKAWLEGNLEKTIASVQLLKQSTVPGWSVCADGLLKRLQRDPPPTLHPKAFCLGMIQSLCDDGDFFAFLRKMDEPGFEFKGALHSEACLASLELEELPAQDAGKRTQGADSYFEGFPQVISTSSLTCPTCTHLLTLLRPYPKRALLTPGSHNRVVPSTLPPWLPPRIVRSMNEFFGAELREELRRLVDRSESSVVAAGAGAGAAEGVDGQAQAQGQGQVQGDDKAWKCRTATLLCSEYNVDDYGFGFFGEKPVVVWPDWGGLKLKKVAAPASALAKKGDGTTTSGRPVLYSDWGRS